MPVAASQKFVVTLNEHRKIDFSSFSLFEGCAGRFWGCSQSWKQTFSKSDFAQKWYLAGLWTVCSRKLRQHVVETSEKRFKTQNIVKKHDFFVFRDHFDCKKRVSENTSKVSGKHFFFFKFCTKNSSRWNFYVEVVFSILCGKNFSQRRRKVLFEKTCKNDEIFGFVQLRP